MSPSKEEEDAIDRVRCWCNIILRGLPPLSLRDPCHHLRQKESHSLVPVAVRNDNGADKEEANVWLIAGDNGNGVDAVDVARCR
jgi:hypothetical protein